VVPRKKTPKFEEEVPKRGGPKKEKFIKDVEKIVTETTIKGPPKKPVETKKKGRQEQNVPRRIGRCTQSPFLFGGMETRFWEKRKGKKIWGVKKVLN